MGLRVLVMSGVLLTFVLFSLMEGRGEIMKYHIYFNGSYKAAYRSYPYALNKVVDYLLTLVNFTFIDPITIVEAEDKP